MTGYGRYTAELDGRTLTVELKSVNHRFLDLNIKLPRMHNFAESIIRKTLTERVARGHLDVYVTYLDHREKKCEVTCDLNVARAYIDAAARLSEEFKLVNDFSLSALMRTPEVVSGEAMEDDDEIIGGMYLSAVSGCVDELNKMRYKEGEAIKSEQKNRIQALRESLIRVKDRAPLIAEEYGIKLRERIQEAIKEVAVDESKLINEIAFFADKCAIDEEITRLGLHLDSFMMLIESKEPNGRKIDFLVQEMNREANTMGSKANDITLVSEVLRMKAEIEKIREQIQNIE
jgi:uncharacterized protein (TIGR00255 family)